MAVSRTAIATYANTSTGVTTGTTTPAYNQPGGSQYAIIAKTSCEASASGARTCALTDVAGNLYKGMTQISDAGALEKAQIFYCTKPVANASNAITSTYSANVDKIVIDAEYWTLDAGKRLIPYGESTATGTSTAAQSGAITCGDISAVAAKHYSLTSVTPNSGWSSSYTGTAVEAFGLYRSDTPGTSVTPGATVAPNDIFAVAGATFLQVDAATFAVDYASAGAVAYSASGGTTIAPSYPTVGTITNKDALVLYVWQKPSSANGGTVTTPTGWTLQGSLTGGNDGNTGGYSTTLGADTGNMNIFVYTKNSVDGTESGTLSVTVGTNNVCAAQIVLLKATGTGTWSFAVGSGKDTAAGNVSIATGSMTIAAGDYVLGSMAIPTDVTTPSQFSAFGLSQSGTTFNNYFEKISEPDTTTGNQLGGFLFGTYAISGSGAGAVTMTATAGGTTTNVRGPGLVLRARVTLALTPTITDLDTDESITSTQTGWVATGANYDSSTTLSLIQDAVAVAQTITSRTSTTLTCSTVFDTGGASLKYGAATARVSDGTNTNDIAITLVPPSGRAYTDIVSVNPTSAYRITATPDLSIGDQIEYGNVVGGSISDVTIYDDGTVSRAPAVTAVDVRRWSVVDGTFSPWATQSFITLATGSGVTDAATAATGSAAGAAQGSGAGATDAATAATGSASGGAQANGAGVTDAATAASGSGAGAAQGSGAGATDAATAATGSASGGAQASGAGATDTATAATASGAGGAQASGAGATATATAAEGTGNGGTASGAGATATATAATGAASGGAQANGAGVTDAATAASGSGAGAAQGSGAGATDAATAATGSASGSAQGSGSGVVDTATAATGSGAGGAQASGAGATATATAAQGSGGVAIIATGAGSTATATPASGSATGAAQGAGAGVVDAATAATGTAAGAAQGSGAGVTDAATAAAGTASNMVTPVYASRAAMLSRYGFNELVSVTNRDGTDELNELVLNAALLRADALINGYLQGRYAVPLSEVPAILIVYACDIARWYLHGERASETVQKRYRLALRFLKLVGSGGISLGLTPSGVTAPSNGAQTDAADRTFTDASLQDFTS